MGGGSSLPASMCTSPPVADASVKMADRNKLSLSCRLRCGLDVLQSEMSQQDSGQCQCEVKNAENIDAAVCERDDATLCLNAQRYWPTSELALGLFHLRPPLGIGVEAHTPRAERSSMPSMHKLLQKHAVLTSPSMITV